MVSGTTGFGEGQDAKLLHLNRRTLYRRERRRGRAAHEAEDD
jgi:hypothetical protein